MRTYMQRQVEANKGADVSIAVSSEAFTMLQAEAWQRGFVDDMGDGDVSALMTAFAMGFYRMTPELEQEFDSFSATLSLGQWEAWTQYGVEPPITVAKEEFEHLRDFYMKHAKK